MRPEPASGLPPIDPNALGVLDESAPLAHGPVDLFQGEEHYLRKGARARRVALWSRIAPRCRQMLQPGERVLHVLPAVQRVSIGQHLGMGWMAYRYNQVALVLTDRRILEVLLDFQGKSPEEQVRSLPWRALDSVRLRFGTLTASPLAGKKQAWSVPAGGDRKLLKLLLPRIGAALLTRDASREEPFPLVHCPSCQRPVPPRSEGCDACDARFRSRKLTALLSLAFPGAGLYYAGHRVLAAFDLVGEVLIYVWFGFLLAVSPGPAERAAVLALGGFFLLLTKAESLHVGHILASRIRLEPAGWRERFGKVVIGGTVVSLVAVAALLPLAGRLAPAVDQDLDFSAAVPAWTGSRSAAEWTMFADDPAMRSEWSHEDGWTVSVFAYALGPGEDLDDFQRQFLQEVRRQGSLADEPENLVGPYAGFRAVQKFEDEDGSLYSFINYFLYDLQGRDVHQLLSVVPDEYRGEGERQVEELLHSAAWIDPIPPF